MDLLIDGTLSQGDYLARKSSLDSELTILESKRKDKRTSTTNWFHVVENTLDFASKARERFEEGDLETKKLIFRSLGSNWVLIDGKLTVDVHSWFSPLQKYEAIRSGSLSRLEPTKKGISMRNTDTLLD